MTIEEKAKAYDEALERAKAYHRNELAGSRKEMTEYIFPELRESEDERIRECICMALTDVDEQRFKDFGTTLKDCLSWLEKQKPAEWSEDDKDYYDTIVRKLEVIGDDSGLSSNQIKFLREHCPLHRSEWSKEDETIIEGACSALEIHGHTKLASMLKSLRPQPQGTYKLIVHNIYEMLKDKDFFDITPSHRVSLLNDIRVKCKDADECAEIFDVPSWKPSEEQMEALETAERWYSDNMGCNLTLVSLIEQLKKL